MLRCAMKIRTVIKVNDSPSSRMNLMPKARTDSYIAYYQVIIGQDESIYLIIEPLLLYKQSLCFSAWKRSASSPLAIAQWQLVILPKLFAAEQFELDDLYYHHFLHILTSWPFFLVTRYHHLILDLSKSG